MQVTANVFGVECTYCCYYVGKILKKRAAQYNLTRAKRDVEQDPTKIVDIRDYYSVAGFNEKIEDFMFEIMGPDRLGNIKKVIN